MARLKGGLNYITKKSTNAYKRKRLTRMVEALVSGSNKLNVGYPVSYFVDLAEKCLKEIDKRIEEENEHDV